nr:MAG TPA: hypothetical protein [Caudoviricetes sp.]
MQKSVNLQNLILQHSIFQNIMPNKSNYDIKFCKTEVSGN